MKKLSLLLFSLMLVSGLMAQSIKIPQDVKYETEDDYKKYEKDVINIAKWLVKAPLDEYPSEHIDAFTFIVIWSIGAPNVSIPLDEGISKLYKKNGAMLFIYMACSAQYQLEHKTQDPRAATKFALEKMIEVYKKGNGLKKDRRFKKLIKAQEKGELDKWMDKNLSF